MNTLVLVRRREHVEFAFYVGEKREAKLRGHVAGDEPSAHASAGAESRSAAAIVMQMNLSHCRSVMVFLPPVVAGIDRPVRINMPL